MNLAIREATKSDLQAVLALYAQPELDDGKVLSVEQAERIYTEFSRYPNYRLFVVSEDDVVIGSYALLIMHNLAHLGTPSAIAEDVVVTSTRRGQGIGRKMMEHAKEKAREAGCYKLALSSNRKRTAAHAFYASLGFAQHGLSFVIEP
jgi:GNAT superfamily N-acetyltransferase